MILLSLPVSVIAEETADLEARLARVERLLQDKGLLDLWEELRALRSEVAELRGQLELTRHELNTLKEKQRQLYNDVDSRLQSLSQSAEEQSAQPSKASNARIEQKMPDISGEKGDTIALETVATLDSNAGSSISGEKPRADKESAAEINPIEAQAAYQAAFRLLKEAEYQKAMSAFDEFLQQYPKSRYADNAHYWMAESYFVTRRFGQAITEYRKLLEEHPDSQRAPMAMLRIANCYQELGQSEDASQYYQAVIDTYPESSAANEARAVLDKG